MNTVSTEPEPDATWDQLAPVLNDGLAALSTSDRAVVTLRFFEKKSHEEIAGRLGVPETVARKRLSRAIDRLRRFFARRGVRVAGTSLMAMLAAQSVSAAPPGLAVAVATAALAKGAGASVSVAALVKSGLSALAWAKIKAAGLVAALAAIAGGLLVGFLNGGGIEHNSGIVLEELQFTNRFEHKSWRGGIATADGRPELFVSTTQPHRTDGVFDNLFGHADKANSSPLLVSLQVQDDRGDAIEGNFLRRGSATVRAESQLWQVAVFPRRGTNLWLRLFDAKGNQCAEFKVPNPAFATYPEFTPEPLPATHRDGNFSVALEEFVTGPLGCGADAAGTRGKSVRRETELAFSLRHEGRPAWAWTVHSLELVDGTGNRYQESRPSTQPLPGADGRFRTRLHRAIWPGEPAWQLELAFVRTDDFEPAELLTIPDLPVPATNQVFELNQDHRLGGHPVRLLSLSGPQPASVPESRGPPGHLVLRVEARGMGNDWRPGLVEVRDDLERPWRVIDSTRSGNRVSFHLDGLVGARALTLRMARQEIRRVTFTARPRLVQTGSTSTAKDNK